MLAKQLSIFLENKSGSLTEVVNVLADNGINLSTLSIAENSDFGILRGVVSEPEKAVKVLQSMHYAVTITDVVGFICPNLPGGMAKVMRLLSEAGIFIEYMYSFACGDSARVIIKPSNLEACIRVMMENEVKMLEMDDMY